ncbi:hypothetical protein SCO11_01990 [Legionella pneumophila serogroup 1]|uniref:hypothetical protein n=1 Tax=Legionella pneumophila TaxID=446 RepID=UPI0005187F69
MAVIDLKDFDRLDNYYFPRCPKELKVFPIDDYFQNLKIGAVFACNDDSPKLIILEFVKTKNNSSILVMCEREGIMSEREGFKPWLIAQIKFENGSFVHSNLGSYFEKDEVDNEFYSLQG